ncbi:aminotransferase class I/II-fold pyridoxal phosphate-dependent enzyme [Nocardia panacis]|uniref:aminotransferase class I/II-fold pyridoxal phosphate-dependent enzyme n=1 Tax=Nocardia panacis TaxID=2340916 RepID=UPI0013156487|nr:aminotransferase class I/II-fold pyridoxal phosphate-dependent enzyme [Nocardia panacis]
MSPVCTRPSADPLAVTARSEARKRVLRRALADADFGGRHGIVDAYHGETGLPVHPSAAAALDRAWSELRAQYRDAASYDKRQPLILRELAARRLFGRLDHPVAEVAGIAVRPEEVVVAPYSSTILLEEAVATIARPGGVLVCPEGFYKSSSIHVAKFGLRMVPCPVAPDAAFKIDPERLARCLAEVAASGALCGVLLTLPGNPVYADYSERELRDIAEVLHRSGVPVICDMAFDCLVAQHIPIASLELSVGRMYDRVLTITGNSKGYNAFGPCKMGAACTGDAAWLARIRERLTISFQRESTHLARAILEHTPDTYFAHNRTLMLARQDRALAGIAAINAAGGAPLLRPLGAAEGMFLSLAFDPDLLDAAGVETSSELEDLLLVASGVDSVALDRTGSARLGVRLNVIAPRRGPGQGSVDLLDELFIRIGELLARLRAGLTYREALAERGLPELEPLGCQ